MYTYEVVGNPPMCKDYFKDVVVDHSGPWESVEAAELWAEAYTNKLNSGLS
jgi:hypothetical protein